MEPITQITAELLTDTQPGVDGCSNADRAAFICEVLECNSVDLNQAYDFAGIVQCKDSEVVEAGKQIATLQVDFIRRCRERGFMNRDDHEARLACLILDIQRMNWHLRHLGEGKRTPPFPFIH